MATALLIIDMQNFFAPMTTSALPNILKLAAHFKSQSLPLLFTQHGHPKNDLTPPYKNQLVRKWGPDGSIHVGSDDWKLQPKIQALHDSLPASQQLGVVAKNTYDAFLGIDPKENMLEGILRESGVERVVVCGVMTDCCCDTTARTAFNRGFETWLVDDACGSASKKQHEAGLRAFGFAFGDVIDTEEVLERLKAE